MKKAAILRSQNGGVLCHEQAQWLCLADKRAEGAERNIGRKKEKQERVGKHKRGRKRQEEREKVGWSWGGRQRNGVHGRATHARSIKRAFTIDQRSIEVDHELKTVVTRGARRPRELFARLCKYLAVERRRPGGGPNDRGSLGGCTRVLRVANVGDVHARTYIPGTNGRNTRALASIFPSAPVECGPGSRIAPIFKDYRTRGPCEPSSTKLDIASYAPFRKSIGYHLLPNDHRLDDQASCFRSFPLWRQSVYRQGMPNVAYCFRVIVHRFARVSMPDRCTLHLAGKLRGDSQALVIHVLGCWVIFWCFFSFFFFFFFVAKVGSI